MLHTNGKLLNARSIVTCIVACYMANLCFSEWFVSFEGRKTDFVRNPDVINNLKECLTELFAIVRIIEVGEPKEGAFELPFRRGGLFNPVSGDGKVTICIWSLPSIAHHADFSRNSGTL